MAISDLEVLRALVGAARWAVDDAADTEQDRNPETGEEYDSNKALREALEAAELRLEGKEAELLIDPLDGLIGQCKLILWIHGKKRNYLVPAVAVSMNGLALQVEGDPAWILDSVD